MRPLSLLAAHVAYPETVLSDDFLCSLLETEVPQSFLDEKCTQSRSSVLPADYITATKNRDWWNAGCSEASSATDLGYAAVCGALEKAGIQASDVGLVIGATLTPHETCPAEATRIASQLGCKIPAFDIVCSDVSLFAMVESLLAWRQEDLPRYIVCVASHVPSRFTDFSRPEGLVFGDSAAALVLTREEEGAFSVEKAWTAPVWSGESQVSLDVFSSLHLHTLTLPDSTADSTYFRDISERADVPLTCLTVATARTDRAVFLRGVPGVAEELERFDTVERCGYSFDVSLIAQFLAYTEFLACPEQKNGAQKDGAIALLMPHSMAFRGGLILTPRRDG